MTLSLSARLAVAERALGRSVIAVNPRAAALATRKSPGYACVGVKDTVDIPGELLKRLFSLPGYLPLTVDRMSDMGRSVDTELVNPLTYRPMTGSTSGGAVNVLKGIDDLCVGTDGGGSVLAPALASSLYALMGKGVGLACGEASKSTDGLGFVAGVGFIGRSLELVVQAAQDMSGVRFAEGKAPSKVHVPARGCALLPGGEDMFDRVAGYAEQAGLVVEPLEFEDIYDRRRTVRQLRDLWSDDATACVLTFEGPIDVFSSDETIPLSFIGPAVEQVAGVRSKAVCKAVNIAGGTGICVPTPFLASGLLVSCGAGVEAASGAVRVAERLDESIELPASLTRYFLDRSKEPHPLELF